MTELLLEIFSEEIPARMQARAADDLARLVGDALKANGLEAKTLRAIAGPRRVTLVADGLPKAQPDTTEERKGPQVGAPDQAIQGFLKGSGLKSIDQAEVRELPKGKFYFAVTARKGRPTAQVVKDVVEAALPQLPWPKSMRWATNPTRWVRPLHGIVCLFDGKIVPVEFAGVKAGDTIKGHRFLKPAPIKVKTFADYAAKLKKAFVLVEPEARAKVIAQDLAKLAAAEKLTVRDDAGLLAEVTGLAEWPVALLGTIDSAFMGVPPEVLTSAMRKHQKYFALEDKQGRLSNRFGVIANMTTKDKGKAIIAGNERVLRARLSDAKFFWDQDRKQKLEALVPKLEQRVFQAKLGTVLQKVVRVQKLVKQLASYPGLNVADLERAAWLSKADLSSGMVGEFPDLQGIMGRYYAINDGEKAEVAEAIAEHYSPLGPNDKCPKNSISILVSLADKIDTLVGFFGIDEKPTGSKDPFALRRAALGVIRLILENDDKRVCDSLLVAISQAQSIYFEQLQDPVRQNFNEKNSGLFSSLIIFFDDRLTVYLRDTGARHDQVAAVPGLLESDNLLNKVARVEALRDFLTTEDGVSLLIAYRRAANILRIEQKKDATSYAQGVHEEELGADEAVRLLAALGDVTPLVDENIAQKKFSIAMEALAKLRQPVDIFFEKVTVNAEDQEQRKARLRLLSRVVQIMNRVADFSKIEG